jgi:superfamily II DNA or RNA helicase
MSLQKLNLQCEYRSDQTNTVTDFYVPCLNVSREYWRAVGYFTSHGLALAARGLSSFVQNDGQMRLVASPMLTEEDIAAMQEGYRAREDVVEKAIIRELDGNFAEIVNHRLKCLAWLVAENRLDIKIASPSELSLNNRGAIYHEKIGIFIDGDGNTIAFTGSPNETFGGLLTNFESIDVYWSWSDPHQRVHRKIDNFKRLWNNLTPKLSVLDFPIAAKQRLLEYKPTSPPSIEPEILTTDFSTKESGKSYSYRLKVIDLPPTLKLRDYQQEAIKAWFLNGCCGFLEMATGSGKTITALSALVRLVKEKKRSFILITCPFQHLVEQWDKEASQFGFQSIVAYQSQRTWADRLNEALIDFNFGGLKVVCIITTHDTFISETMQRLLTRLQGDAVLVADEAHHLGATRSRQNLPNLFNHRLGLSATPNRWFDPEGTTALRTYFGKTVYEFPLAQAIEAGHLCSYFYLPHLVELTEGELYEYEALTAKIAKLYARKNDDEKTEKLLEAYLRQRADLLNKAENKLPMLKQLVINQSEPLHHALFYCAPGQIDEVIPMLGHELGLHVHRFTAEESTKERQSLLERFASGNLQGLVAMKCLDEGVDVPGTQSAYILASSSNPREFIQRRGRILRSAPGKVEAKIYDLIAVPSLDTEAIKASPVFETERKILRRELKRFHEFSRTAKNQHRAVSEIWQLARTYNLMSILGDSDDQRENFTTLTEF